MSASNQTCNSVLAACKTLPRAFLGPSIPHILLHPIMGLHVKFGSPVSNSRDMHSEHIYKAYSFVNYKSVAVVVYSLCVLTLLVG